MLSGKTEVGKRTASLSFVKGRLFTRGVLLFLEVSAHIGFCWGGVDFL
jgi:hypothetical protein